MDEIPSLEGVRTCIVNADLITNRPRSLLMAADERVVPYAETA